ncbi:MAG: N-acetylmuramoyl-L-alanine amidase [Muribaculaceae bacterium]|nr:N-acetylmuramoyl-L-alanine amidase [Muribaculaceae bacterium]
MSLKNLLAAFCLAAGTLCAGAFTIVIDPGHGGKDYGCVGKITNEKTIVLDVATRLGKLLAEEHPEMKQVFTRSDDRFVSLNDRARIANKANADIFVSIHVNSVDKKTRGREAIHGASVYTLGLHRSDDNLEVAMRENSVIELEQDYSETYQGFDPNSSESYIIFELIQNSHLKQSIELADGIQRQLTTTGSRADKGVRQSGFLVLRATSMPAVLVELDFICNPAAEKFLASESGRQAMARSLATAIGGYYGKRLADAEHLASQSALKAEKNMPAESAGYVIMVPDGTADVKSPVFQSLKEAKKFLHQAKQTNPQAFIKKLGDD